PGHRADDLWLEDCGVWGLHPRWRAVGGVHCRRHRRVRFRGPGGAGALSFESGERPGAARRLVTTRLRVAPVSFSALGTALLLRPWWIGKFDAARPTPLAEPWS